jgi:diguanylate cyclase (GGDEF)-like protein
MNILIVDDDAVDREHIRRTITKSDPQHFITETESVDEALICYQSQQFDVVLVDCYMPQRNGIELLVELRKQPQGRGVAIIMLSNSNEGDLAKRCIRAGAHDFVSKSVVNISRLNNAISHASVRFELEQELHKSHLQTKELAERDRLTGLANRSVFEESLKRSINNRDGFRSRLALLLFDIDYFKVINDSYGYDAGDLLLKAITDRISSCLRRNELFARIGGDEFGIIFNNITRELDVENVAKRMLSILEKPFHIAGIETKVTITISIGIAIYPDNSMQTDELFKFADIAIYRAKRRGRSQLVFFEETMNQEFIQRSKLKAEMNKGLAQDEFILQYQPIFNSRHLRPVGFEALIRWQVNGQMRMPDSFIGIAEETGLILDIGRWVIKQSLKQLQIWSNMASEATQLSISINLSAIQLKDPSLPEFIKQCLQKFKIKPEYVEFELTETAFIGSEDEQVSLIHEISDIGCRIALDDFGTGFSSVSHLHKFPINTVKIDKSLMLADKDEKTLALIKGLATMIHSLGLDIVAEGIETEDCAQLCKELKIGRVQGYYFSKPINVEDITSRYLTSH